MSTQPKRCFTCGNVGATHSSALIDKMFFRIDLHGALVFCKEHFRATLKDIDEAMKAIGEKHHEK